MWKSWLIVLTFFAPSLLHAQAQWPDERMAGAFFCHADFSLANHTNLLDELTRLQRDLVRALGIAEPKEPIHLILFQRHATYQEYLRLHFPDVPSRRAMYIKPPHGPGMVFAFRSAEFEIDVRHEGTHAILHADLPMVPLWLDEGLAEYFEVPYEKRAFDNPHLKNTKGSLRRQEVFGFFSSGPSLEKLEQLRDLNQMGPNEYRQAWAWVHFMLHGSPEAHDELVAFLADIRAHTPPGQISDRLRRRIPNLEREFVEHFLRWKR